MTFSSTMTISFCLHVSYVNQWSPCYPYQMVLHRYTWYIIRLTQRDRRWVNIWREITGDILCAWFKPLQRWNTGTMENWNHRKCLSFFLLHLNTDVIRLWVLDNSHYKYCSSCSAGTVFIRQNLTSEERLYAFWCIMSVPALKGASSVAIIELEEMTFW